MLSIQFRTYGTHGPLVYVLHGGPAGVGLAEPIAKGLSERFRVIEPFQRGSSSKPLSVATHVSDLNDLIEARKESVKPIIVGHSWGAMLALAYGAAHPTKIKGLVLVGCGTFDEASRKKLNETIFERIDDETRRLLDNLPEKYPDRGERLKAKYDLIRRAHDFDADRPPQETLTGRPFDIKAHTETWDDMIKLQENGTYPRAFASIRAPILMIHGSYDPHPGKMIYESLRSYIADLKYVELTQCGHDPWRERNARSTFFKTIIDWMTACFAQSSDGT